MVADSFSLSQGNTLSVGEVSFILPDADHRYRNNDIPLTTTSLQDCAIVWKYKNVQHYEKTISDPLKTDSSKKIGLSIDYYKGRLDDRMSLQEATVLDSTLSKYVELFSVNQNASWETIVSDSLNSLYFTFPVGAIKCLNRIKKMSLQSELLLLAADKANTT